MDKLYRQAVNDAKERSLLDVGASGAPAKRSAEDAPDAACKKPKKVCLSKC
jgi:hypothetical protein